MLWCGSCVAPPYVHIDFVIQSYVNFLVTVISSLNIYNFSVLVNPLLAYEMMHESGLFAFYCARIAPSPPGLASTISSVHKFGSKWAIVVVE